ncbi:MULTISPECIES: hypothetical protein [Burkholderia cepacia complex]|uniref:hypothetical protein n=1 Tax=Burkholderia cepacia complex TaxID=87882 RepID=UPI0015818F58|nr:MULTISPECIES: hypothetical protein [Burkholderia cepacia complex]
MPDVGRVYREVTGKGEGATARDIVCAVARYDEAGDEPQPWAAHDEREQFVAGIDLILKGIGAAR